MGKKIVALCACLIMIISSICLMPDTEAGVQTFNVTNDTRSIMEGSSFKIKINGLNPSKVSWTSSKPSVATVNKKGIVNGIKTGKAVIKGRYKGILFNITVNVYSKNTSSNFSYSLNNTVLRFTGAKYGKAYYGEDIVYKVSFTFENKGSEPTKFADLYDFDDYINGVDPLTYNGGGQYTAVLDGGIVNVDVDYDDVKKGDKIKFVIKRNDTKEIIFSNYFTVK